MSNNLQTQKPPPARRRKTRWRWVWRIAIVVALIWGAYALLHREQSAAQSGTTFTVRRGPLNISVLVGGNLEAMESQKVKCEVEGQTKILSLVQEGYVVSQEDVDSGKVLIELDSKELQDRKIAEELEYQNASSILTEATEEYAIQANQNRSDITAAQLTAKFARMDFERFMGVDSAKEILTKLKLADVNLETVREEDFLPAPVPDPVSKPDNEPEKGANPAADQRKPADVQKPQGPSSPESPKPPETTDQKPASSSAPPPAKAEDAPKPEPAPNPTQARTEGAGGGKPAASNAPAGPTEPPAQELAAESPEEIRRQSELRAAHAALDFAKYADSDLLGGGEARQKLRKLEDDELLAEKELVLSQTQFEGTQRLAEKDFVTKNDLENERLKVERNEIALQTAKTAKDLFIKYEFVKTAEKNLSDFEEALAKLERAKKLARSKMTQTAAKRRSAEKRFNLQTMKVREINEQVDKCRIRAKRPGLVVYSNPEHWRDDDQIREGSMVRNRQDLIEIPDLSEMAVKVKIHEASIKLIAKGQIAKIKVDAYPDEELTGEVVQVDILPDAEDRWMNPDVKVYETKIHVQGSHDWVKPGMSAQVEILVKELPDVTYIPIQAIVPADGEKVCYVVHTFGEPERRPVEIGDFNNEFIEVKSNLTEGEQVLLRAPVVPEDADRRKKEEAEGKDKTNDTEKKGTRKPQNPQQASAQPLEGHS